MNHVWMMNHQTPKRVTLLMMQKLKNRILKIRPEGQFYLEFKLRNIRINGCPRGCSGFIRNSINNRIVYVNTEPFMIPGYLRRYAESMTDYTGGINMYSRNEDQFALDICKMLFN